MVWFLFSYLKTARVQREDIMFRMPAFRSEQNRI